MRVGDMRKQEHASGLVEAGSEVKRRGGRHRMQINMLFIQPLANAC
jgi:hypothetical protein